MNPTIYKQTDDRWRWLPYPGRGYFINGAGCGCLSVLHCVIEIPRFRQYTVPNIIGYMRQHATYGDGTKREGITAALKHFGLKNIVRFGDRPMKEVWPECNKGGRIGIILFNDNKAPDGTQFTTGGHYIAFSGYRVKNGRHEFYLKDSAWRNKSGWKSYERSMRGCIIDIWTCTAPQDGGKTYSGKLPDTTVRVKKTVSRNDEILKALDEFCWPKGTPKAKWSYDKGSPKAAYKSYCGNKGRDTLSDCGYLVKMASKKSIGIAFDPLTASGMPDETPPSGVKIIHKGSKIPAGLLEPGDFVAYKKKSGQHTFFYYGNGLIAEAGRLIRFPVIHKAKNAAGVYKWNTGAVKKDTIHVYRAVKTVIAVREYLRRGDKGAEILKWQKFLHWYFGDKVTAGDGVFGEATLKYTKLFQQQNGLAVDGTVGKKTIAKAREVKR